jgi:hypothetical protein
MAKQKAPAIIGYRDKNNMSKSKVKAFFSQGLLRIKNAEILSVKHILPHFPALGSRDKNLRQALYIPRGDIIVYFYDR